MNRQTLIRSVAYGVLGICFSFALVHVQPAYSGSLALATSPLANSTTSSVLPNLMFIIDGSGSMGWNYLPDWANDSRCKSTSGTYDRNCENQPPFQSPDFNGIYYNPAIKYTPAVNADGTSKPSQGSPWTSVKNDAYGVQSASSTNLITSYVDVEWCTDATYTDCLRNDNYILPGVVGGKSYTTVHTTTSSGSGKIVTGPPDAPTVEDRSWGPHYYTITPGEYCTTKNFKKCVISNAPVPSANADENYIYPVKLRWCNSNANASAQTPESNSCQALYSSTFKYPRYPTRFFVPGFAGSPEVPANPGSPGQPAVPASVTFSIGLSCTFSRTLRISNLYVGANDNLSGNSAYTTDAAVLADYIRANMKNGYTATGSGTTITLKAPISAGNLTSAVSFGTGTSGSKGSCTLTVTPTTPKFSGYQAEVAEVPATPYQPAVPARAVFYPGAFVRTDIISTRATYPRASTRTDCVTSTTSCTYEEEMTNFANWFTYYQTRMQAMKTSVSLAFKPIDNRYRIGFIDLWGNNYLPIEKFDGGTGSVKEKWYTKLFSIDPNNGTPLRSALARVGRLYAGKKPVGTADPVQYSCQKNFALLTTDGYWNTDSGTDVKRIDGTEVGNQDGGTTPRPQYEGPTASASSLADVAKYYHDTDIRNTAFSNCTGSPLVSGGTGLEVCNDTPSQDRQFMTTFSLGLGVEGRLQYTSDYKTATSGDYFDIANGVSGANWPVPQADTETAVDDLWHAAVNGGGTYFSARNPAQLTDGLRKALSEIDGVTGAGAAAATSSLNPTAGDNYAYVASYNTVKWTGNLEARTINTKTGDVSKTAKWCVENVTKGVCSSTVVSETVSGSTVSYCVTPDSTADSCAGSYDAVTKECKVELPVSCTGTMAARQLTSDSDDRTLYMAKSGALAEFTYDNLTDTQKTYFDATGLSQWSMLDDGQKTKAAGANLVNFLRGHTAYEDRSSNVITSGGSTVDNRLYRYREATLGDAVESQPAYVGKPDRRYVDIGYSDFAAAKSDRVKTVFLGTNDGMLHAFNAENGQERWAFIPSMVIPNLWELADKNYSTMHRNSVNGKPVIADICPKTPPATCDATEWKTILVAGLNGGGRGYYALDITNPAAPSLLWEIDATTTADVELKNIGYTFGAPTITKKADGTWVVLLTSGYNNTSPGDGKAYIFVRNPYTGAKISTIETPEATTLSGLARLSNWADDPVKNNTSRYAYGGDLLGNLWRIDINAETVTKIAVLKDKDGNTQPVTSAPELGAVNGSRIVFVATGKYLEKLDLTDSQRQTVYAIKDDSDTAFVNPRASAYMFKITIAVSADDNTIRKATYTGKMDFAAYRGWWADLPDSGERSHVDPILDAGLLIVPTTVPSSTVCEPGGYGWLNYFNYKTGATPDNIVSQRSPAPIVGVNVFYDETGRRVVTIVKSNDPNPDPIPDLPEEKNSGFLGKRVIWRELIQ